MYECFQCTPLSLGEAAGKTGGRLLCKSPLMHDIVCQHLHVDTGIPLCHRKEFPAIFPFHSSYAHPGTLSMC